MLTNNNKRSFVKLLALTLAALMVFSVCLTGCTDEDARAAAENAQATADAATTEAEVAAKITEALAPYLKSADAITEDKVKSIVADAIKGCATTDDLAAFAKSSDMKALSDKLASYVTTKDVETAVKNAMASYDIDKKINDAIAAKKTLTADEVQKMINDSLKNYLTAAQVDARIETALKGYFGNFTAAEVQAMMTSMDKAMNLDDWNEATTAVITVLADADDLLTRAQNNTFTQAAKKAINELSGLTIFVADDKGVYGAYDGSTADATMAALGLQILRAPNLTVLDEIAGGISAAADVESLEDELEAIRVRLYALGNVVDVFNWNGDADNKNDDDGEKYAENAAKANYHGENRAKQNVVAQVVTAADRDAFTAIQQDLDEMMIEYAVGCVGFTFDKDDVYTVYSYKDKDDKDNVKEKIVKAGTYKNDSVYGYAFSGGADFPSNWKDATIVRHTIGIDTAIATSKAVFDEGTPAKTYKMVGYYDGQYNDPKIAVDLADFGASGDLVALLDSVTPDSAKAVSSLSNTYAAIITMLNDAEAANTAANDKFTEFLKNIGKKDNGDFLTDAEYLTKLEAYMCEETEDDKAITVPTTPHDWTKAPWLTTVTEVIDYAQDINGNSVAGIKKYDLYEQMISKSYDLLFNKYQLKALEVLTIMLNDYTVAVQAAVEANAVAADYVAANTDAADALKLESNMWTTDFLGEYYNGTKTQWEIGKEYTNKGLKQYYTNNGVAFVPTLSGTTKGYEKVTSDVLAVLKANAKLIQIELAAATVGPRMAILASDVASKKSANVPVSDAFDAELETAKKNLDEIMYRWIYAEIKDAILNDTYSYVVKNTTGVYTNGLAWYFNQADIKVNAGVSAEIEDILKKYVTGYNDAKAGTDAAYGFKYTEVLSGTTPVGYTVDKQGNGAVVDALNAIVVADADKVVATELNYVATKAVADAEAVRTAAIETMADKAVAYKFNDYLSEAKSALFFTFTAFNNSASSYASSSELLKIYNTHLEQITIVEYMRNRNAIPEADYRETFVGILQDVIASNSPYYSLIKSGDKDTYAEFLKDVKSSDKTNAAAGTEGWFNIVKPTAPYSGAEAYFATGAAAIDFDKELNKAAVEKKADGTVKTASLY